MDVEKEKKAIERLKMFEPDDGYYVGYSGGKDSDVVRILCELAGVKHELHHNLTTVDAPETVYYVRSIGNVKIDKPDTTMWRLIVQKGIPPLRQVRYCCEVLKERTGEGKITVTGVRWAESNKRKDNHDVVTITKKPKTANELAEKYGTYYRENNSGGIIFNEDNDEARRLVEHCYRTTKTILNPIVDWTDGDVWDFLGHYGCKSNPLYECGWKRIGCIGCPMAGEKQRLWEFREYPKYKENYIRAFDRMLKSKKEKGKLIKDGWQTGDDVFRWWVLDNPDQQSFLEDE